MVVRPGNAGWEVAVIEPRKEESPASQKKSSARKSQKLLLALPKGLVDPGEKPEQTAVREVFEETGLTATVVTKLGDIKYVYVRTWADGERVFKIVSFYLLRFEAGNIDEISDAMRIEVKRAMWIHLQGAASRLAYRGEKDMLRKAEKYVESHAEPGILGREASH